MKGLLRVLSSIALCAASLSAAALYMNVYDGNDQPGSAGYDQMLVDIQTFDSLFNPSFLSLQTKFDPVVSGVTQDDVTVVVTPGAVSGSWTSAVPIALIIVKADGGFKAYYYGIPGSYGEESWDTAGIGSIPGVTHAVSHLSAYTHPPLSDDPIVPEPSTWVLILTGVAAIGVRCRSRRV